MMPPLPERGASDEGKVAPLIVLLILDFKSSTATLELPNPGGPGLSPGL